VHDLPPQELSKDSLHWGCIVRDGGMPGGVRVLTALEVLLADGQPLENYWPYRGDITEDAWLLLPPLSLNGKPKYKIAEFNPMRVIVPKDLADILKLFGPICLVVRIWESFFTPHDGRIRMPDTAGEEFRGNHALCVVGVTAEGDALVRNSWGANWGDSGHVLVPFQYLQEHAQGMYALVPEGTAE